MDNQTLLPARPVVDSVELNRLADVVGGLVAYSFPASKIEHCENNGYRSIFVKYASRKSQNLVTSIKKGFIRL